MPGPRTAGLCASADVVEGIGVARAREAARQADLVLYLVDATRGRDADDEAELRGLPHTLVVATKSDLSNAKVDADLSISATTGAGLDELFARLDAIVRDRFAAPESSPAIVNERQRGKSTLKKSAASSLIRSCSVVFSSDRSFAW